MMLRKRIVSLGACLMMAVTFSLPVHAETATLSEPAGAPISIQYVNINDASSYLTISSDGDASIKGYVKKTSSGDNISLTVTLQRSSGGSWENVTSWSKTTTSPSASISKTYSVSSGTYRVKTAYSVTGDGGTESGVVYSKTVTY